MTMGMAVQHPSIPGVFRLDTGEATLVFCGSTNPRDGMEMIGREVLFEEEASANYRLRQVQRRRTGEIFWEVLEMESQCPVAVGLPSRDEALRIVRGWERLHQRLEGGLPGHVLVH